MPKLVVPKKCPFWIENHTYDEWKQLGYGVLKGQKAKYINDKGDWVFTQDQAEEILRDSDDDDWMDEYDGLDMYGSIGD